MRCISWVSCIARAARSRSISSPRTSGSIWQRCAATRTRSVIGVELAQRDDQGSDRGGAESAREWLKRALRARRQLSALRSAPAGRAERLVSRAADVRVRTWLCLGLRAAPCTAFCTFSKALTSIWRMRSRETPNSVERSSSVTGSSARRRASKMRRSRSFSVDSASVR